MRFLLPLALLTAALALPARAEITVSPLRQVLTERDRTATYRVSNPSDRIIDGRVAWIDMKATPDGYEPAAADFRRKTSAAPYLTVWPAFFSLEPGGAVTVTVAVKDGARIPAGERRSHLLIEANATRTPLRKAGGSLEADIGLGISTPVILRGGALPKLIDARLEDTRLLRTPEGLLELETRIAAESPISLYGAVTVYFRKEAAGEATKLGEVRNVAVYPEAGARRIIAPLGRQRLPGGILEIRYGGASEFAGRTFAQKDFELAPPE